MRAWALSILFLIFASKVSFSFLAIPWQFSILVFQHGLHPYMNIILNFVLGLPLLYYMGTHSHFLQKMSPSYRAFIFLLLIGFLTETLLQNFFLEGSHRGLFAWAALISSCWLVLIFGIFIPSVLTLKTTLQFVSDCALVLVAASLAMWVFHPELVFKGGRFIGVFKHIPYMVTCSTVGIVFTLGRISEEQSGLKRGILLLGILLSFFALLMTGTRSALAASVFAVVLWVLRMRTQRLGHLYFKYSAVLLMTIFSLLFGHKMGVYIYDIATGQQALLERDAQDGVSSRLAEVERGWDYFLTSPWIGRGLLAKFSGNEGLDVNSYNSFKDPHNIFASAGVVGGWPFIWWTGLFLIVLVGFSLKALTSDRSEHQVLAIYVLVQIPILIIYHWHLSLGGMADRIYWLAFGYLALFSEDRPQ